MTSNATIIARVADVAEVVDGDAADVDADLAGHERLERDLLARAGVVDAQRHRGLPDVRGQARTRLTIAEHQPASSAMKMRGHVLARAIALDQQVGVVGDHDRRDRVNGGDRRPAAQPALGRARRRGRPARRPRRRQLGDVGRDGLARVADLDLCDRGRRARRAPPARRAAGKRTTNVQRAGGGGRRRQAAPAPAPRRRRPCTRPVATPAPRRRATSIAARASASVAKRDARQPDAAPGRAARHVDRQRLLGGAASPCRRRDRRSVSGAARRARASAARTSSGAKKCVAVTCFAK